MLDPCKKCIVQASCTGEPNCPALKKTIKQLKYVAETALIVGMVFGLFYGVLGTINKEVAEIEYITVFMISMVVINPCIYIYLSIKSSCFEARLSVYRGGCDVYPL